MRRSSAQRSSPVAPQAGADQARKGRVSGRSGGPKGGDAGIRPGRTGRSGQAGFRLRRCRLRLTMSEPCFRWQYWVSQPDARGRSPARCRSPGPGSAGQSSAMPSRRRRTVPGAAAEDRDAFRHRGAGGQGEIGAVMHVIAERAAGEIRGGGAGVMVGVVAGYSRSRPGCSRPATPGQRPPPDGRGPGSGGLRGRITRR